MSVYQVIYKQAVYFDSTLSKYKILGNYVNEGKCGLFKVVAQKVLIKKVEL